MHFACSVDGEEKIDDKIIPCLIIMDKKHCFSGIENFKEIPEFTNTQIIILVVCHKDRVIQLLLVRMLYLQKLKNSLINWKDDTDNERSSGPDRYDEKHIKKVVVKW